MAGRVVAVVGGECSGKTTLCVELGRALPATVVGEQLRRFVARQGRVPRADEQAALMLQQIEAAEAAPPGPVVSDGGALMTAVYSVLYFDDDSLLAPAVAYHRQQCALTVWCGIDLPWHPDPGQRDGPMHRERADAIIGTVVAQHGLPVLRVTGPVPQRLAAVLGALTGRR